ncbi:MAG: GNAT family N-acetyltransferase [Burkholderiales bacterium]|nr:GNAT family N-acetyltransferase [Burkholderiales bacterium]
MTTDPIIRFAQADDLTEMLKLYRELRPLDPTLPPKVAAARWADVLADANIRVVVAEVAGQLAATCMIVVVPNLASGGRPFAVIEHVVTAAAQRGRGLGRAVLQHALDFAWSRDACKVMLLSGVQRAEAHRLYESLGFRGDVERGFVAKRKP